MQKIIVSVELKRIIFFSLEDVSRLVVLDSSCLVLHEQVFRLILDFRCLEVAACKLVEGLLEAVSPILGVQGGVDHHHLLCQVRVSLFVNGLVD